MINKDDRKIINQDKEEWIGERPFHWGKSPLKKFVDFEKGKDSAKYTKEYMYEFRGRYPVYSGQTANQGVMGYIKSYDYNIDECLFTTTVGAKAMTISYLKGKFSLSQNCLIMTKKSDIINLKFIYYFLIPLFNYEKTLIPSHMQPSLRISDLKSYSILEPPLKEQNYIVKFLDVKIFEIDTLISDKEKLITLLEEKRQAIITEAVTKGLDPDVKMKDSGVEWIGEIPEHWESKRMKYLIFLNPPKSECLLSEDATVTFAPMEKVLRSGVLDRSLSCSIKEVYSGYTYFRNGDIIMAKVTPCFENGNIALAQELTNGVGFGTTELHVIRAKKHILNEYLYYLLRSDTFRQNGIPEMYGVAGLKRLPSNYIENYKVPLPSISEQRKIVKKLKENISLINIVLENINVQLCKLKEYRESLIYEAVTGKIDVQEMMKETEQEEVSSL